MIEKLFKLLVVLLFFLALGFVYTKLFFPDENQEYQEEVRTFIQGDRLEEADALKIEKLRLVYAENPSSLDPSTNDPIVRQRLVNIYETLVFPNSDLQIRPSLAYSWGLIDDYTWEFHLRPNVLFHDNSTFDVEDVVFSYEYAMQSQAAGLSDTLDTIEAINPIDKLTFQIVTKEPDPLLLQKLSYLFIHPSEGIEFNNPVGTGPYQFLRWEDDARFIITAFPDYWGKDPKFETVEIYTVSDPFERVKLFVDGQADFLTNVPISALEYFQGAKYNIETFPSLEVQFLFFNMESNIFSNRDAREAFSMAVDQEALINKLGEYVQPVNQFVSSGIFGYSPSISEHRYDENIARQMAIDSGIKNTNIEFHLLEGLDVLGDFVKDQLGEVGVNVNVTYLDLESLSNSIENKEADLYFMAYRSESGDAGKFFKDVIYKEAPSNIGNYRNNEVETILNLSEKEMDQEKRLFHLQEAMDLIVEEDIIGVPLFEFETIYSFSNFLSVQPRLDGLVIFDDINHN